MKRLAPALLCLGLLASACGGKGSSLAGQLTITPPDGYIANSGATGSLDRSHAATALPYTVTDDAKNELSARHYKRGNVKVWTKGTAFATVAAMRFASTADANALIDWERSSIRSQGDTAYLSAFPPVKIGYVFIVSGVAKGDQRSLFCQGVFFGRLNIVYFATTCDTKVPDSTTKVTAMAKQLVTRAGS